MKHPRVLAAAQKGVFREDGFPRPLEPWLKHHLLQGKGTSEGFYRIKPEVQKMIRFERLNLIKPWPSLPRFSAIFCRNVMIYFDRATQGHLVNKLADCLEPGGYLFVGHAESLSAIQHPLSYVCPATYQKRGGA